MKIVKMVLPALLSIAVAERVKLQPLNITLQSRDVSNAAVQQRDDEDEEVKKLWEEVVCKGTNLVGAMSATDREAGIFFKVQADSVESQFQTYPDDLTAWGYQEVDKTIAFETEAPNYFEPYKAWGLDSSKKLPPTEDREEELDGTNVCFALEHSKDTVHKNIEYRATGANFRTIANPKDGVIIGWHKFGPAAKGPAQNPPVTVFPKLQKWSDIAFLSWKSQGGDGSSLRYIWSAQIANDVFDTILGYALSISGHREYEERWTEFDQFEECPNYAWENRVELSMDTEAGRGMLGSPNGRGAGYLLAQHKETFGETTTISHVTFYCGQDISGDDPEFNIGIFEKNIIFHVSRGKKEEKENMPEMKR